MENLPQISLLEQRHSFPCAFTFKVIGTCADGFVGRVVSHIREELELSVDPPFVVRQTKSGRHVAITFEPDVASAVQVIEVYKRLTKIEGVVMLL